MSSANKVLILRFLAQPGDVNFGGNVHGGTAMKWLDEAGYVCATAWSGQYCVTAFVGDINFRNPIPVGNLVEVQAKIIHTGRTSMHIAVDLYSCSPKKCELLKAIHCIMVFVAVDEKGNPVEVPSWKPINEEDIGMEKYAIRIMELRKVNQKDLRLVKPDPVN
jgi:acyl-CoA hydrolase